MLDFFIKCWQKSSTCLLKRLDCEETFTSFFYFRTVAVNNEVVITLLAIISYLFVKYYSLWVFLSILPLEGHIQVKLSDFFQFPPKYRKGHLFPR